MGRQSSRIFFKNNDHKDIYFQGKYHNAMYYGKQGGIIWRKLHNFIPGYGELSDVFCNTNTFTDYSYSGFASVDFTYPYSVQPIITKHENPGLASLSMGRYMVAGTVRDNSTLYIYATRNGYEWFSYVTTTSRVYQNDVAVCDNFFAVDISGKTNIFTLSPDFSSSVPTPSIAF